MRVRKLALLVTVAPEAGADRGECEWRTGTGFQTGLGGDPDFRT